MNFQPGYSIFSPLLAGKCPASRFFHGSRVFARSSTMKEGLEKRFENQDNVIRERSTEN